LPFAYIFVEAQQLIDTLHVEIASDYYTVIACLRALQPVECLEYNALFVSSNILLPHVAFLQTQAFHFPEDFGGLRMSK